ncbi:MAG: hypothetical protein WD894_05345 [Pirellulales bacterium]
MSTPRPTPGNHEKVMQLEALFAELLIEVLRRGFHGRAAIELAIQDGVIQHIRRTLERLEK